MPHDDFFKIDEEYYNTILEEDFRFEGTIKFEDSLIIKGYIKGKIESKGDLIVGPNAIIDADVSAKTLECFGKINGNISVQNELFFHNNSVIKGNIVAPVITIDKGCNFNGFIKMETAKNEKITK